MDAVLLFSGGPDSTTLAYKLAAERVQFLALTLNFGEEEGAAELRTARDIAAQLDVKHRFADFTSPMRKLYDSEDVHILRQVVDRKNDVRRFGAGIALSLAGSVAAELGASAVYYAVHANDRFAPDNNRTHFNALQAAISTAVSTDFSIATPFLDMTKIEVFQLGERLGVPFEKTWSCVRNSELHCGACDACYSRDWAFAGAQISDPTPYEQSVVAPTGWMP